MRPSFALIRVPPEFRGRRECRVQAAPMARLQQKNAGGRHHRSSRSNRHSLRDGFNAYSALLGVPGFVATVALQNVFARLDPSVGGSGPRALAVRENVFVGAPQRAAHHHVHRILFPTSVTIASRPSRGIRMRGVKHIFLKNGR